MNFYVPKEVKLSSNYNPQAIEDNKLRTMRQKTQIANGRTSEYQMNYKEKTYKDVIKKPLSYGDVIKKPDTYGNIIKTPQTYGQAINKEQVDFRNNYFDIEHENNDINAHNTINPVEKVNQVSHPNQTNIGAGHFNGNR